VSADDALDLLASLVEKSLVSLDAERARYGMLDTVRHYALDRLVESADDREARSRHLAWCLNLAERARQELVGPQQALWLDRLDRERENVLAAHRWCDQADAGIETGLQLVFLLKHYWYQRGLVTLGHRISLEALARAGTKDRTLLRCRGLADVGQFCSFMGRYAEARQYLEESLSIARELNDARRVTAVLEPLGFACLGVGDLNRAEEVFSEGIKEARALGNPRQLASLLNSHAQLRRQQKDLSGAEVLCSEALELLRELGDEESAAIAVLNLAMISVDRSALDSARVQLIQALAAASATGSQMVEQALLDVTAGYCTAERNYQAAVELFGASEAQAERSGLRRDSADSAFLMPLIALARSELGPPAFAAALSRGKQWSCEAAVDRVKSLLMEG
jgi:non-specific serine/threonine protein kinase